ncbi:MAG: Tn3 family transposase [Terriglobia bacterium]
MCGGLTLTTPKQKESDAEHLQQFFPERRFVPLVEVLATVNRFTRYLDELQHPQQRYHHGESAEATIYAGVIGIGCAIGLHRMMRISRGVSEAELEHTVNWHFTLDGLQTASDRVVRLMDRLELPNLARRVPDQLHLPRRTRPAMVLDRLQRGGAGERLCYRRADVQRGRQGRHSFH